MYNTKGDAIALVSKLMDVQGLACSVNHMVRFAGDTTLCLFTRIEDIPMTELRLAFVKNWLICSISACCE